MPLTEREKIRRSRNPRPDQHGERFSPQFEANKKIILATQSTCAICGGIVDKTIKAPHPMSPSIDHIIPVSRGGHPSDISNLQLTHRACNRAKGSKIITEKVVKENIFIQSKDWRKD